VLHGCLSQRRSATGKGEQIIHGIVAKKAWSNNSLRFQTHLPSKLLRQDTDQGPDYKAAVTNQEAC